MRQGQVYVIRAVGTDSYKIGFTTKTPEERRASLQTGNPRELEVVAAFVGTTEDERRIHQLLEDYRQEGEWFRLTVPDLIGQLAKTVVLAPTLHSEMTVASPDQIQDQVAEDYARYSQAWSEVTEGAVGNGSTQPNVSSRFLDLLQVGVIDCRIWMGYDEDQIYQTVPFERGERMGGKDCFELCVDAGYIQKCRVVIQSPSLLDQVGRVYYRINPDLNQDGYDFFMELWEQ
jgi:hypothetical protein